LAAAVEAGRRSAMLAGELYTRGLSDFLAVLDAQERQLASEDELARSDTALLTARIALYKALGGGWDVVEARTGGH
jgi:multidrug efflux system outer membrane protein